MKLSPEEVRHVAKLARLSLGEGEEELYAKRLSAVLSAADELAALDVSAVAPTSHATLQAALFRKDETKPSLPPEKSLGNAPKKSGTSFAVPKIIE